MKQVIDALEAERAEVVEHLQWLDRQLEEFRDRHRHDGATSAVPARSNRRATARRASQRRATARTRRGNLAEQVVAYLRDHPGSTAGDVAKGLNANRNTVATRLSQMTRAGEISKAEKGYTVKA
jgi:predicted transcriptional regulator